VWSSSLDVTGSKRATPSMRGSGVGDGEDRRDVGTVGDAEEALDGHGHRCGVDLQEDAHRLPQEHTLASAVTSHATSPRSVTVVWATKDRCAAELLQRFFVTQLNAVVLSLTHVTAMPFVAGHCSACRRSACRAWPGCLR
jgi:hypothetical protein